MQNKKNLKIKNHTIPGLKVGVCIHTESKQTEFGPIKSNQNISNWTKENKKIGYEPKKGYMVLVVFRFTCHVYQHLHIGLVWCQTKSKLVKQI